LKGEFNASQRQWHSSNLARMMVQADKQATEKNHERQGRNEQLAVAEHEYEEQEWSSDTTSQRAAQFAEVIRAGGLA
jgi:uncharacterized protein YhjY with autotransporter beta-barrel domain